MYLFIYYNKWGTFSCSACVCGGQASECISHIFKWIFMQRLREMSCCLTESQKFSTSSTKWGGGLCSVGGKACAWCPCCVVFRGFPLVVVNNFYCPNIWPRFSLPRFSYFYLYFYIYRVYIFKTKWRTPFQATLSAIPRPLNFPAP